MKAALGRGLLLALPAATLGAALLVSANGWAPAQRPLTFGLAFWGILALAAPLVLVPLAAAARERAGALAALVLLVLVWGLNAEHAARILWPGVAGPARFRWGLAVCFLAAQAALLCAARREAGRAAPALAALAAAAGLTALWPLPPAAAAPSSARREARPPLGPRRLLLVGLDGADWTLAEPLLARGELPHLARLRARGAWGPLQTLRPARSPIVWTTVASGRTPEEHGISDFELWRLQGVDAALGAPILPRGFGLPWLLRGLRRLGLARHATPTSDMRRTAAYWDVATAHALPVDMANWWATWPAEPIVGRVVSERVHWAGPEAGADAGLTFPAALWPRVRVLRADPAALSAADLAGYVSAEVAARPSARDLRAAVASFQTDRAVARLLLADAPPASDLLIVFRIVDLACHAHLHHARLADAPAGPAREAFGEVVAAAYRAADAALGELLAQAGEADVLVLSDHGWARTIGPTGWEHDSGPDGIFVAAGPAFRPGWVGGLSVYDVFPLMLYLKGFALPPALPGKLPTAALEPTFLQSHPPSTGAPYARLARPRGAVPEEAEERLRESLRALGYVR